MSVQLEVAARTDIGRVRSNNEDAFIAADLTGGENSAGADWTGRFSIGERGALVAVSDGMGGASAGEVASGLVVGSLAEALASEPTDRPSLERIAGAVEDVHRTVWAQACRRGIDMGATLTAVYVRGTGAYVAEVGDSRAYLIRAGRITQLTKDQSYMQMLVDRGLLDAQQTLESPFRNLILQAMGYQPRVKVALGRLDLRLYDCLLLCSDGLSSELADAEIRDVVLTTPDLQRAADRLVTQANERGGHDNTTVVLVGVSGDLPVPDRREPVGRTFQVLQPFDSR
jgi:serine/threonine protein phosphatase PrpC